MKINQHLGFRNNKVIGQAINGKRVEELADECMAFQLCAIGLKFEMIVLTIPTYNITAGYLQQCFEAVVQQLASVDVIPLICSTDNAAVNRTMFDQLAVKFPTETGDPDIVDFLIYDANGIPQRCFFLPDVVHAVKNVRNQTLGPHNKVKATFIVDGLGAVNPSIFRALYESDRVQRLRLVPAYSESVVNPTSIQRQNVGAAVKVFWIVNQSIDQSVCEWIDASTAID